MDFQTISNILYIFGFGAFVYIIRGQNKIIKTYREMLHGDIEVFRSLNKTFLDEIKAIENKKTKKVTKDQLN